MNSEHQKILSVDQLPDDPLKMPPPYWRSGGAIFHLQDALWELESLLEELVPVHARTEALLDEYYREHPEEDQTEEVGDEFGDITEDLFHLEHKIQLKAEIASLMSAIEMEDMINRFCVFNLHKDISESIERLSPPEKLLVAVAAIGKPGTKRTSIFEAVRRLSLWRNAFAHGHCVDRPTKSLRHNHLIHPNDYPGVRSVLAEMRELVGGFVRISDYLKKISINPSTKAKSADVEQVRKSLGKISNYRFDGNNYVYDVMLSGQEQQKVATALNLLISSEDPERKSKLDNVLTTLDSVKARLVRLEFGIDTGKPHSKLEIQKLLKMSSEHLAKERAIALTRLSGVVNFMGPGSA